jgi:hypothetical protein
MLHLLWALDHLTPTERTKWLEAVRTKPDRYPPYFMDHKARREAADKPMLLFAEASNHVGVFLEHAMRKCGVESP